MSFRHKKQHAGSMKIYVCLKFGSFKMASTHIRRNQNARIIYNRCVEMVNIYGIHLVFRSNILKV